MNRTGSGASTRAAAAALGALLFTPAGVAEVVTQGATILYETGFEEFEGFAANDDLMGQGGWVGAATDLEGELAPAGGNGILAEPIPGFTGQYAYIGFTAPTATADFSVWHPVNLSPPAPPLPLVRFRVSFQIYDSTTEAPRFDDFRWSIYNAREHRLFSLDFDNDLLEASFILDGQDPEIEPTGFNFATGVPYDLEVDLNFGRNLWTARINGAVIVNAQPITTENAELSFGDADAVWVIREPGKPGDNYMIFDDYRVTVEPLSSIPPTLEPVGMLNTGAFVVRIIGEPGVNYQLQGSENFSDWSIVATGMAQSPGGYVDLQDSAAHQFPKRVYRAVSQPE